MRQHPYFVLPVCTMVVILAKQLAALSPRAKFAVHSRLARRVSPVRQRCSPNKCAVHATSLDSEASTLGVDHAILEPTKLAGLSGAVLKQSPLDFVVVELPLEGSGGGVLFTPTDIDAPLAEDIQQPVIPEAPPLQDVIVAVKAWKLRWEESQGLDEAITDFGDQEPSTIQQLQRGFDCVARCLEG
ncbi:unnamed protein product [Choristocarpus tenellus]